MANTLFLRLEGPLQSWGERARWSVRDSAPEPTKSGVVGLLGCALGLRDDKDLQQLSRQIHMGVRCDRPGRRLVDYHTVSGGVMSAEGKIKKNAKTKEPETVVSWRTYLCDASFLVAIQSEEELVERLAQALMNPVWPVYLGRKSCPPGKPVLDGRGDFPALEAALRAWPLPDRERQANRVRVVIESPAGEGVQRRDELLSRSRRTFGPRYVREYDLTVLPISEVA